MRDPRIDPKPGDVVKSHSLGTYRVVGVDDNGDVWDEPLDASSADFGTVLVNSKEEWCNFFAGQEVIARGSETTERNP